MRVCEVTPKSINKKANFIIAKHEHKWYTISIRNSYWRLIIYESNQFRRGKEYYRIN